MNDALRLFFIALLAFSGLVLYKNWTEWQSQNGVPAASAPQVSGERPEVGEMPVPSSGESDLPAPTQSFSDTPSAPDAPANLPVDETESFITVETDWLVARLSRKGGSLIDLRLKTHLFEGEPLPLLENQERLYIAQSGLIGDEQAPNHHSDFVTGAESLRVLGEGEDSLTVTFLSTAGGDIALRKRFVFRRSDYRINVLHEAQNNSDSPRTLYSYFQLVHDGRTPRGYSSVLPTFFGAGMYTKSEKFVKVPMDDIIEGSGDYPRKSDNGWLGIIQRYFAAVWIPPAGEREYFLRHTRTGVRVGMILPMGGLPAGGRQQVSLQLFAGAQEQDILNELSESGEATGINLIVDYGWLTFIAVLLFSLLTAIQSFVVNWGVAIILLTVGIKLLFYPLSSAAYRSMAKMKEEAPRIKEIQNKFKEDKQRMQQEMMALYREKKINPLGGCLPILVQIPVFIALYWVLLGSVELRQAPFFGWIQDLSIPDPYFILPLIMGGSMYLQTAISPAPPDPTQAMIMRIMPIGFALFSIFFPSGLVLYWAVNTLLSIAQQWHITRTIRKAGER